MTLNPFDKDLESVKQKVSESNSKLKIIRREIDWFEGADLNTLLGGLDKLGSSAEGQSRKCDSIKSEAVQIETSILALSGSINSRLNPKNWFDSQQRELRASRVELKESLERATESLPIHQGRLEGIERRRKDKINEIEKYKKFDFDAKTKDRSALARWLSQQKKKVEIINRRKQEVDVALEPIIKQISEVERKKSEATSAKQQAHRLDDELSCADNSYERAMAHKTCEEKFGTGSPRKVISKKEAEIRRFDRDLEKLRTRGKHIAGKAARDVRQLIIDGNNLCYEGDSFLGLDVLRVLVPALADSFDVTVVFDASIRRAMKCGDTEIRDVFGGAVKVHVVAATVKADETVLDLAGAEETAFIISNDRFAEFGEKLAVRNQRLIRHEIVAGKVLIHDLGISEPYRE